MRAIMLAAAAALALVAAYLALGGASYAPAAVADPCSPREGQAQAGFERVAEGIVLSALDGVACELGVSREEAVLAFSSRESLDSFAREHGDSPEQLESLARAGLRRAVVDAERAGLLEPKLAAVLEGLVARIPVAQLLDLLERLPQG